MKHKILISTFLPAALSLGIGVNVASACWFGGFDNATPEEVADRQTTIFQREADILGITIEELKNYWTEGKTLQQIAQEKGITQDQLRTKMRDLQLQRIKDQLKILVDKGVITQGQADKRLQFIQNQQQNNNGHMNKRFFRGFHL